VTPAAIVYSFRSISVTETNWISQTSTTMEDDSIDAVSMARAENLAELHRLIAVPPPPLFARITSSWREPYDDMSVEIQETLIKQDLMTGKSLSEREMEPYKIPYQYMGTT